MSSDERRQKYANGLSRVYLPFYEALCSSLPDHWQPYYGLRSVKEQDALYRKGRDIQHIVPKDIVTNARGGESAHNYGCATDWTIFNEGVPIWMHSDDPEWQTYADACEKVGLLWGGNFKSLLDYYHNEVKLSISWKEVKVTLDARGMDAALSLIERTVVR